MITFDSVQQEIEWARSNLNRAGILLDQYVESQPFSLVIEDDAETGGKIHKIKRMVDPPTEIGHLIRNSILDLKHSFDRSLHVAAFTAGREDFNKNYPWSENVAGLKAILRSRQSKNSTSLPLNIIKEIFRQKPYSGEKMPISSRYLVREMAQMANNKHSIGFEFVARPSGTMISGFMSYNASISFGTWDAVNKESVFVRVWPGGHAAYGQTSISVDIFFKRDGPIGKVPASVALREFLKSAQMSLEGFQRVCGV
ncbi:hypothetical protein [Blastomonas sp. SL216]|uniref:hypothetical protein n=1 Tax=Blastomonas sp. SL216 TaxID=2995169 RepID=UPI002377CB70|nr:hypothetical protein OU999_14345 [Blastomonas sp. SL216]